MSKKVVFIAHSYHRKTHSCDFMVDYLKEFFDVIVYYDEEWETGCKIDWTQFDSKYYAVIIWQMFPQEEDFKKIPNKNITYFPMYDQAVRWHFKDWYNVKDIKIISFSSTLYKKLKRWGFNVIKLKYFIEPKEFFPGNPKEVFFWQRHTKLNIKTVINLLKGNDVKIHLHKTVDPGQKYVEPSKKNEEKFQITYSEWFDSKEELQEVVKTKGIYVTPRYLEGIGMSFLEAMAQGKVVIAHNAPTMNEYIKNGETGFLCNFRFPLPINLRNVEQIQKNTYDYAKAGYEKWLIERKCIIELIKEPSTKVNLCFTTKICLPFLLLDTKKIVKFKLGSNASLSLLGYKVFQSDSKN